MASLDNIKNIHFVGIGGISMSGLAEIMLNAGYKVTGSDLNSSKIIERLINKGAAISIPHDSKNVEGSELIVYTAAVKKDNVELVRASELSIPIMDRAEFLGIIMKKHQYGIAISGCHGKTTTTSMVSLIFKNANLDPTILLGGELDAIDGNVLVGKSDYFITEACEYFESFLKFYPYVGAILNVEEDHLDYFKDIEHIMSAFYKFTQLIPKEGSLVVCADNENAMKVATSAECNLLTYGIDNDADYTASNIYFDQLGHPRFDVYFRGNKLGMFSLNIPGKHNILNSLASIAIAINAGIDIDIIKNSLLEFRGTYRRFDIQGTQNNITVIDDYAHHPTEIKATLDAAVQFPHKRVWCIFQPHTYSRTRTLFKDFALAFNRADKAIIADIYSASREKDNGDIHSTDLVTAINQNSNNAIYIKNFEEIADLIAREAEPGDIVFTMGAGDVFKLGQMILDRLNKDACTSCA
ncbi:MAG: UDP-N-acetylmuramate--L-alanine ligase [Clostridiales bacterium GWB2_37_7]|nr:MAG: UDP-N-acetylmuramate--L-alanine ligase [Clostridiales bacterium GWB2_37_7]